MCKWILGDAKSLVQGLLNGSLLQAAFAEKVQYLLKGIVKGLFKAV